MQGVAQEQRDPPAAAHRDWQPFTHPLLLFTSFAREVTAGAATTASAIPLAL